MMEHLTETLDDYTFLKAIFGEQRQKGGGSMQAGTNVTVNKYILYLYNVEI